jgi:hypothetical protein
MCQPAKIFTRHLSVAGSEAGFFPGLHPFALEDNGNDIMMANQKIS